MEYGLEKIPFSRYGSYFAVSINQEDGCLYLRDSVSYTHLTLPTN